jgi:hypothetical protein
MGGKGSGNKKVPLIGVVINPYLTKTRCQIGLTLPQTEMLRILCKHSNSVDYYPCGEQQAKKEELIIEAVIHPIFR